MSGPRYSQAGIQALKQGEAAYRAGDRIVPARQARELLAAVEDLPPRHDCPGLNRCTTHPRWFVARYGAAWGAYPPYAGMSPATTSQGIEEALRYATVRARAEQLAAITHSEGTDALPTDLETP